jgi:hypothetical protein
MLKFGSSITYPSPARSAEWVSDKIH